MADSDHAVRLRSVLDDLAGNHVTLGRAVELVRAMHFPSHEQQTTGQLMTDSCLSEAPEKDPPGSAREISAAYTRGKLTLRQYEALSSAAADSIKADEKDAPDPDE